MKARSNAQASQTGASALDSHHRIFISCLAAAAMALVGRGRVSLPQLGVLTWDAFSLCLLGLAWYVIAAKDPYEVRRNARLQDSSGTLLFALIVSAATASLVAVGLILHSAKGLPQGAMVGHLLISSSAIVLSWALVHTSFTMRYAHFYFFNAREEERADVTGGLDFPGKKSVPDYLDFAYFSFIIGMTCQVSDVQISSRRIRRLALLHGIISFFFNTAILAIFVNIVAGLV